MPETYELENVPIFSAGVWNGDSYQVADLDHMVAAFNQVGFYPPMKLGHDESQALAKSDGMPAIGWVANLRRVGTQLYCDIKDLPKRVYEAIKRKNYNRVSAEVYWDYNCNGKKWPRVLKALSLLGADIPAVTSLEALETLYDGEGHGFKRYDMGLLSVSLPQTQMGLEGACGEKKDKATINYRQGGADDDKDGVPDRCGSCKFFQGPPDPNGLTVTIADCSLVEGDIASTWVCDLYEPMEAFSSIGEMSKRPGKTQTHGEDTATHFVRPHGEQFAVVQRSDGKVIKVHPTRAEAMAHLKDLVATKASELATTRAYIDFTEKAWVGDKARFSIDELKAAVPDAVRQWAEEQAKHQNRQVIKDDLKLPFREPDGVVNLNGVRAALSAIGGSRTGKRPNDIPKSVLDDAQKQLQNILAEGNKSVRKTTQQIDAAVKERQYMEIREIDGEFCVMKDGEKQRCFATKEEADAYQISMMAQSAAEVKALQQKLEAAEQQNKDLANKVSNLEQTAIGLTAKFSELEDRTKTAETEASQLKEQNRKASNEAWLSQQSVEGSLKVFPWEQPYVSFILDSLTGGQVKTYADNGAEITPAEAFKKLYEQRKPGTILTQELSSGDATKTANQPEKHKYSSMHEARSAATKLAKVYMKEHPEVKEFAAAFKAVLEQDEDLKSAVSGVTLAGAQKARDGAARMQRMFSA